MNPVTKDIKFPFGGIDNSNAFAKQEVRPIQSTGEYVRTAQAGNNVRSYEPLTDRMRGGSRPGLSRYVNAVPGGSTFIIQELAVVVTVDNSAKN